MEGTLQSYHIISPLGLSWRISWEWIHFILSQSANSLSKQSCCSIYIICVFFYKVFRTFRYKKERPEPNISPLNWESLCVLSSFFVSTKGNLLHQLTCGTIYSGQNNNTKHWVKGNWNDSHTPFLLARILASNPHSKLGCFADSTNILAFVVQKWSFKKIFIKFLWVFFCFKSMMNQTTSEHFLTCLFKSMLTLRFPFECTSHDLFDLFNQYATLFIIALFSKITAKSSCELIPWPCVCSFRDEGTGKSENSLAVFPGSIQSQIFVLL